MRVFRARVCEKLMDARSPLASISMRKSSGPNRLRDRFADRRGDMCACSLGFRVANGRYT